MNKTVVALYDRLMDADAAVRELIAHGFSPEKISLVASDVRGEYSPFFDDGVDQEESNVEVVGVEIGTILGGLGGLLVGLGLVAVPGIGPIIAAGPLATAVSGLVGTGVGAAVGGATGGLIGILVDVGIDEINAGYYAEALRRGGSLVMVEVEDYRANEARRILDSFGSVEITERVDEWRNEGWRSDKYESDPYTIEARDPVRDQNLADFGAGREFDYDYEYDKDFVEYDPIFRDHYDERYADIGYPYKRYQPAYYYGYELAINDRYAGWDWDDLEPEAQRGWESRQDLEGDWDNFVDAVYFAWKEVKEAEA